MNPQVATLPVEPFGTQSPSKFQHFTFFGQKLNNLVVNLKLNLNNLPLSLQNGGFCNTYECVITVGVVFVRTVLRNRKACNLFKT